eukprot:TRINITY_DN4496_c0_g1_i1.p1 TRINITY_DN4496_c0_g1~~TRINITY_DN4496_c0_g1_i1.p1  ORF type:complete len:516 (-),score=82.28 TRINITY_DN4496_c0_g1_i1:82-1629(-)
MNSNISLCALLLLLLISSLQCARFLYVDSAGGSDVRNDGSQEFPWKSIAKALSGSQSGDTIFLLNGPFNESLVIGRSISIRGLGNSPVRINGYVTLATYDLRNTIYSNLFFSDNTHTHFSVRQDTTFTNVRLVNVTFARSTEGNTSLPFFLGVSTTYIGITGAGLILDGVTFTSVSNTSTPAFYLRSVVGPITLNRLRFNGPFSALIEGNDITVSNGDLRTLRLRIQRVTGLVVANNLIGNNVTYPPAALVVDDVRNAYIFQNVFRNQGLALLGSLGQGFVRNVTIRNNTFTTSPSVTAISIQPRSNRSEITVFVDRNRFLNNSGNGISLNTSNTVISVFASYNYWGDPSGPQVRKVIDLDDNCNFGNGITVSPFVQYRPWCRDPDCTVHANDAGECVLVDLDPRDSVGGNYRHYLALSLGAFASLFLFVILFVYILVGPRYDVKREELAEQNLLDVEDQPGDYSDSEEDVIEGEGEGLDGEEEVIEDDGEEAGNSEAGSGSPVSSRQSQVSDEE